MKAKLLFTIPLSILLLSCNDETGSKFTKTKPSTPTPVVTPISEDKCDNDIEFLGIREVTDITDTSVKIKWDLDPESIGYTIFQSTPTGLVILSSANKSESEIVLNELTEETNYSFLLRTINSKGFYDCNQNYQNIDTTEKQIFVSCNEINNYYENVKPSGVYEIDPDKNGPIPALNVYCDMDNNDGGWTRVFTHDTTDGLFLNDTDALEKNLSDPTAQKYSILSKLSEFMREGKFEFWLYYPEHDGASGGNRWTQTSNPTTDSIASYVSLNEDYTDMYWGGLEKSTYNGTLIDGSVASSWWFYAIGANKNWPSGGTIPGPLRSQGVTQVQLFIK